MPDFTDAQISMQHGAGGQATHRLVEGLFASELANPALDALGDAAVLDVAGRRLAVTTDTCVVKPHEFPGGSIGALAVHAALALRDEKRPSPVVRNDPPARPDQRHN